MSGFHQFGINPVPQATFYQKGTPNGARQKTTALERCSELVILVVSQYFVECFNTSSGNPVLVMPKPSAETVWYV